MPKPLTVGITINCGKFWERWEILREMGIPDHLTCFLRNLYAGQEAYRSVRTGHGTTDWFQIGKGGRQGCILSPCLFNLNVREFMIHVLLKPGLENFEHHFTSMWDECNCAVVWAVIGIAFLWNWNENWPFPILWPLLSFHICWQIECSTFTASSFRFEVAQLEFHHFH